MLEDTKQFSSPKKIVFLFFFNGSILGHRCLFKANNTVHHIEPV
jgi:hypothetical protein